MSGERFFRLCSNLTYLISNFRFFLLFIDFTRVCQIIGVALYTKECQLLSNSNPFAILAQFFTSMLHFLSPLFAFVHKPVFKIIKYIFFSASHDIPHVKSQVPISVKRDFPCSPESFPCSQEIVFIQRRGFSQMLREGIHHKIAWLGSWQMRDRKKNHPWIWK